MISIFSSRASTQTNATASESESDSETVSYSEAASAAPAAASAAPAPDLELLNYSGSDEGYGGIHIKGVVKNNTNKTYGYVQIQFSLFDKAGNQVGTALANTNGLEPGGTWKFDAIGIASDVAQFKLLDLIGY